MAARPTTSTTRTPTLQEIIDRVNAERGTNIRIQLPPPSYPLPARTATRTATRFGSPYTPAVGWYGSSSISSSSSSATTSLSSFSRPTGLTTSPSMRRRIESFAAAAAAPTPTRAPAPTPTPMRMRITTSIAAPAPTLRALGASTADGIAGAGVASAPTPTAATAAATEQASGADVLWFCLDPFTDPHCQSYPRGSPEEIKLTGRGIRSYPTEEKCKLHCGFIPDVVQSTIRPHLSASQSDVIAGTDELKEIYPLIAQAVDIERKEMKKMDPTRHDLTSLSTTLDSPMGPEVVNRLVNHMATTYKDMRQNDAVHQILSKVFGRKQALYSRLSLETKQHLLDFLLPNYLEEVYRIGGYTSPSEHQYIAQLRAWIDQLIDDRVFSDIDFLAKHAGNAISRNLLNPNVRAVTEELWQNIIRTEADLLRRPEVQIQLFRPFYIGGTPETGYCTRMQHLLIPDEQQHDYAQLVRRLYMELITDPATKQQISMMIRDARLQAQMQQLLSVHAYEDVLRILYANPTINFGCVFRYTDIEPRYHWLIPRSDDTRYFTIHGNYADLKRKLRNILFTKPWFYLNGFDHYMDIMSRGPPQVIEEMFQGLSLMAPQAIQLVVRRIAPILKRYLGLNTETDIFNRIQRSLAAAEAARARQAAADRQEEELRASLRASFNF